MRSRWTHGRSRPSPRAKRVAFAVWVLVVAGAVVSEFGTVSEHLGELAAATITLNVAAMAASFTVARLARLDDRQATAIAMELGIHNATVAIAIGASVDELLTIPAAVYSAFMFVTAGAFARVMARRNAAVATAAAGSGTPACRSRWEPGRSATRRPLQRGPAARGCCSPIRRRGGSARSGVARCSTRARPHADSTAPPREDVWEALGTSRGGPPPARRLDGTSRDDAWLEEDDEIISHGSTLPPVECAAPLRADLARGLAESRRRG